MVTDIHILIPIKNKLVIGMVLTPYNIRYNIKKNKWCNKKTIVHKRILIYNDKLYLSRSEEA